MKFLANENFPQPSVELLRRHKFDVLSISENYSGVDDKKVLEIASAEGRIILTFDKDYGEIIFRYKLQDPPAVVFFRFKGNHPESAGEMLLKISEEQSFSLQNSFTIVSLDSIRQKKYK